MAAASMVQYSVLYIRLQKNRNCLKMSFTHTHKSYAINSCQWRLVLACYIELVLTYGYESYTISKQATHKNPEV